MNKEDREYGKEHPKWCAFNIKHPWLMPTLAFVLILFVVLYSWWFLLNIYLLNHGIYGIYASPFFSLLMLAMAVLGPIAIFYILRKLIVILRNPEEARKRLKERFGID